MLGNFLLLYFILKVEKQETCSIIWFISILLRAELQFFCDSDGNNLQQVFIRQKSLDAYPARGLRN